MNEEAIIIIESGQRNIEAAIDAFVCAIKTAADMNILKKENGELKICVIRSKNEACGHKECSNPTFEQFMESLKQNLQ